MLTVQCATCGKSFGAQRKTAKFCSTKCRVRDTRARAAQSAPPPRREGANLVALPPTTVAGDSLAAVTAEDLEKARRLRTPAGLLAVKLAQILDSGVQDTGSSIAALGRQYLATMEKALDGADAQADPLDQILARRRSA